MLGFLRFISTEDTFHVLYVHVASAQRHQKIGEKLFESAMALADVSGHPTELSVGPENTKAKQLYKKFGFAVFEPIYIDGDDQPISEVMRREPLAHLHL